MASRSSAQASTQKHFGGRDCDAEMMRSERESLVYASGTIKVLKEMKSMFHNLKVPTMQDNKIPVKKYPVYARSPVLGIWTIPRIGLSE